MNNETQTQVNIRDRLLTQQDLYELLPFGESKVKKLIKAEGFPVVKMGKDYVTTFTIVERWLEAHLGEEFYFD